MRPQRESSTQEVLAGLVERVTYHNSENGFCVLRAKVRGHRDVVTVVGHAATIAAGEWITASGEWVNDRIHGQQFKARFLRTSTPTSADGIEKYLSSGMIRGVGPVYAKKLVEQRIGLALAESQIAAIRLALASKVLVMTGGPGVGKTSIVKAILRILAAKGTNLLLCAPPPSA
jgi:ATP-dependent exoDNAse (exonuclease V) alpha subunit